MNLDINTSTNYFSTFPDLLVTKTSVPQMQTKEKNETQNMKTFKFLEKLFSVIDASDSNDDIIPFNDPFLSIKKNLMKIC